MRLIVAWYKFDKYYKLSNDTPVHAAAALLHPQLREAYLRKVWSGREQQKWIKPTITNVRNLWRDYFKPENVQSIDLDSIKDPAARFLAEMTISTVAIDEFDDFIKVYLKKPLITLANIYRAHKSLSASNHLLTGGWNLLSN